MAFVKAIIFIGFVVALSNAQSLNADGKLKITVVTTAGCGDTVNFITNQVQTAFSSYFNYLDIEFVPWGRTVRNGESYTCQFGVADCFANNVMRCANHLLGDNIPSRVFYQVCEFSQRHAFLNGAYNCAQSMGVNLQQLDQCMVSSLGTQLSLEAEEKARIPMGTINFVPAIVIGDEVNTATHWAAFANLSTVVCNILLQNNVTGITC